MDLVDFGTLDPFQPTKEEWEKIVKLRFQIKEHLNNTNLPEVVHQAVVNYNSDHIFLLKFIRGRKLNIEKAKNSVFCYANVRFNKYPEMFLEEVPGFVRFTLGRGILTVLRHRDDYGRVLIWMRTKMWDVSELSFDELVTSGRYLVEAMMNLPGFLEKGMILLTDCEGATIAQARQHTIPSVIRFISVFWQAYPIQIKGLYYINAPFFAKPVFTILKPIIPGKLRERILISSGVTELHQRIRPEILPGSLGGPLSEAEAAVVYSEIE